MHFSEKFAIVLLCISVLTSVVLFFMYRSASIEREFYMNLEKKTRADLLTIRLALNKMPMRVVSGTPSETAMRVAEMQDQVNEGIRIIEQQRDTITRQNKLLKDAHKLNKRRFPMK